MKTIVIANQKGGVGKTTTAAMLALGLARAGRRVLALDADAQGNLGMYLGATEGQAGSLAMLLRSVLEGSEQPMLLPQTVHGVDVLTGDRELSELERRL